MEAGKDVGRLRTCVLPCIVVTDHTGASELLISEVLEICTDERMQVTQLIPVYAAFVTYLHCVIGDEVGGTFLEQLAKQWTQLCASEHAQPARNLTEFFCHIYLLKLIPASLIFELIDTLIARLKELDIELLLIVLTTCGTGIRSDDPASLKVIIQRVFDRALEGRVAS